ncbi:hypothetical protein PAT3040_03586 [Paenibacillus agaridevorans]|uniref:Uncharacterized protein n=1 Tax=Paenibacillus agaridevorans TaxID=171404 RepID=A0A2R5ETG3_9BACL|nr:hypothetical protein [Paenibacillus agaridevorans]GBG08969.1 hypothetical protein PAT3040_03586 [Paenibacillus agaridevorans]
MFKFVRMIAKALHLAPLGDENPKFKDTDQLRDGPGLMWKSRFKKGLSREEEIIYSLQIKLQRERK